MLIIFVLVSGILLQVGGRNFILEKEKGAPADSEEISQLQKVESIGLRAGCNSLPARCIPTNKATCTINNCKDQCRVNCCNGKSASKCQIPTCKSCNTKALTDQCKANANKCVGLNGGSRHKDYSETLRKGYLKLMNTLKGIGLGAGCNALPAKCIPTNKVSCTLNNCKDLCNVNCCNGSSASKCQIPTCKGCRTSELTNQCKTDTQKCTGIIEDSDTIKKLDILSGRDVTINAEEDHMKLKEKLIQAISMPGSRIGENLNDISSEEKIGNIDEAKDYIKK